jgi:hypothetical protein
VLERADLPADRGLRHVEALCGAAHVAFLGNGDEIADLRQAHVPSVPVAPSVGKAPSQIKGVLDGSRSFTR